MSRENTIVVESPAMEQLAANFAGKVRREYKGGRWYTVAPATMMVSGVLNGSKGALYYPPEEIAANIDAWNGMPIVVNHPQVNGQFVSARDPEVMEQYGIGFVYRVTNNGKLGAELWLEEDNVKRIAPTILERVARGEAIELSTGLFTDNEAKPGTFNGKAYDFVARNYRPDHLAILPDKVGACSLKDGCGVLVNEDKQTIWQKLGALLLGIDPVANDCGCEECAAKKAKKESEDEEEVAANAGCGQDDKGRFDEGNTCAKGTQGSLKPGDKVVYSSKLTKEVKSIQPAQKKGYQVITFTDGSRGGAHESSELQIIRASDSGQAKGKSEAKPMHKADVLKALKAKGYKIPNKLIGGGDFSWERGKNVYSVFNPQGEQEYRTLGELRAIAKDSEPKTSSDYYAMEKKLNDKIAEMNRPNNPNPTPGLKHALMKEAQDLYVKARQLEDQETKATKTATKLPDVVGAVTGVKGEANRQAMDSLEKSVTSSLKGFKPLSAGGGIFKKAIGPDDIKATKAQIKAEMKSQGYTSVNKAKMMGGSETIESFKHKDFPEHRVTMHVNPRTRGGVREAQITVKVEKSYTNNQSGDSKVTKLTANERVMLVDDLIANCECWDEADKPILNRFSDEKLQLLVKNACGPDDEEDYEDDTEDEGAGRKPSDVMNERKPKTAQEWMAEAPAEIRSVVANAITFETEQKKTLIAQIVANSNKALTVDFLKTKELSELKTLARAFPTKSNDDTLMPLYFGAAAPAANESADEVGNDILPIPTMNWGKEKATA